MSYPDAEGVRAMTVQEVILKALSGESHSFRAADILGFSPRTLRRRHPLSGRRVADPPSGRTRKLCHIRPPGCH